MVQIQIHNSAMEVFPKLNESRQTVNDFFCHAQSSKNTLEWKTSFFIWVCALENITFVFYGGKWSQTLVYWTDVLDWLGKYWRRDLIMCACGHCGTSQCVPVGTDIAVCSIQLNKSEQWITNVDKRYFVEQVWFLIQNSQRTDTVDKIILWYIRVYLLLNSILNSRPYTITLINYLYCALFYSSLEVIIYAIYIPFSPICMLHKK
jgi:hypothetical protein